MTHPKLRAAGLALLAGPAALVRALRELGRLIVAARRELVIDLVGLLGLAALALGLRAIYPPAASIVVGLFLIAWAIAASRK